MIISALANNGTIIYEDGQPESIKKFLQSNEGKTVYITFSERRPPRTLDQNAYYHGVVVKLISDYTGDDTKSTHESLRDEFCPEFFDENGKSLGRSTTRLTTKEFGEYIDRCINLAGQYGIAIPEPNSPTTL